MSQITTGPRITRDAGADLSAKQYYILKLNSSEQVILAAAATDKLLGTLANKPESGDSAEVMNRWGGSTLKVIAGGTVAVNDKVTSDGNGKAITTTTAGNEVLGIALEAAVSGDIFEVAPFTGTVPA